MLRIHNAIDQMEKFSELGLGLEFGFDLGNLFFGAFLELGGLFFGLTETLFEIFADRFEVFFELLFGGIQRHA